MTPFAPMNASVKNNSYDYVLGPEAVQSDIYQQVQGSVSRVLEGYNSTIMAYGQTSSGKTHSMFGASSASATVMSHSYHAGKLPEGAGVIPRAMHDLFVALEAQQPCATSESSTKTIVYCSFVQIYNEQLYDMLRDSGRNRPLEIHEDSNRDIYVQGLSEFRVKNMEECLALLRIGEENRAIRETHMNQASSRSHSLFQVVVEQELGPEDPRRKQQHHQQQAVGLQKDTVFILRSKLNLVDLAGSEKWDTTQEIADQHAQELANINLSLFTLGRCIAALCASANTVSTFPAHIPYRESKLTRLIQDSLGGNTKTYIIATLSPTADCAEESISTLKFADRAKQVLAYVRPYEEWPSVDHLLVEQLKREVTQLRALVLRLRSAPPASSLVVRTASIACLDEEAAAAAADRRREEVQVFQEKQQHALKAAKARVIALEAALQEAQTETTDLRSALTAAHDQLAAQQKQLQQYTDEGSQRRRQQKEEEALRLDTSNNLRHRVQEVEQQNKRFVSLLTRFFKFEIQEGDLRHALIDLVPNVDDYIGGKGASCPCVPLDDHRLRHLSPTTSALPHNAQPLSGQEHNDHHSNHGSFHTISRSAPPYHQSPPSFTRLQVPPSAMTYRIRGAEGVKISSELQAHEGSSQSTPTSAVYPHNLTEREKEEQMLIDKLNRARKRMQRHIKLQEWLVRKEQKELAAMEREENERRRAEDARKEMDQRFRERARRQKKKLEAYYIGLSESVDVEGDGGVKGAIIPLPEVQSFHKPSPFPPLPSPPRFRLSNSR